MQADPIDPLLENVSKRDTYNTTLKFINIEVEPSKAIKDEGIRRLIRANARRSGQRGSGAPEDHPIPSNPPAHVPVGSLPPQIPGRTRFALTSRQPMTRVRSRIAAEPLANELRDYSRQVISGTLTLREVSSNWVPPKTKPNIGRMLQHCKQLHSKDRSDKWHLRVVFDQLVDNKHDFAVNGAEDFEVLATGDQGLFHAGLAIASVYHDTGTSDHYYSQQALQVVSRRLSDYYLQASDETIGAVGLLIIHDVRIHALIKS